MKKLNNFYISNLLHKKVYDEEQDFIGKLFDVYLSTDNGFPRAIGYQIKKNGEIFNYEFRNIDFYEDEKHGDKIHIEVRGMKEIIPRTYSYLLAKHLLDKQIVDINGKKLVRVNDVGMAIIAGELRVMAVDTSPIALARRLGIEKPVKFLASTFHRKISDSLILWENVEALEMVSDNLKLSVPYKKLSNLHPADIADILEDMDTKYRNMVFQNLDYNLAADTLEEVDPEVQKDILQNLSEIKTAEVLEEVPNDEIADMLDEVDEETAEKILLNMEKEDAEEVRALMEYEEESVGSIMNKDFICFNINISAAETIDLLREIKPDAEVAYYIYITDEGGKLQGVVSLRNLVIADPQSKLKDIMDNDVFKIKDNENIDDAVEYASKYNLMALPVVDDEDVLCGIVIMSDIIEEVLLPSWRRKRA